MTGQTFDALTGATWMGFEGALLVHSGDDVQLVRSHGYVSLAGQLAELPPIAQFDSVLTAAPDQYAFNDSSVAAYGAGLTSYQWEFKKITDGVDDDWVTVGHATGRFPTFTYTGADWGWVKLTVTDEFGQTAYKTDAFQIFRDDDNSPPGDVPIVTVEATDNEASESGDAGTWTLTRSKKAGELTVDVSLSGSATAGADYEAIADEVTFPDLVDEVEVTLVPVADALVDGPETATLTIDQGTGYTRGDPYQADITILDTTVPPTTAPGTTVPATTVPPTTMPGTTIPPMTTPGTTSPGTTVPATTAPPAALPPVGCIGAASVAAGTPITVCGDGFLPGEQVQVLLHSVPAQLTVVTADAAGTARATVTVPADTVAGLHHIELHGVNSGRSLVSAPFTITKATAAPVAPEEATADFGATALPLTGAGTARWAITGMVLVIAGLGILRGRRRMST
ncbi:MAG TPA: hypothetical protein VFN21_13095 [Acidimicrobiales bacterium]|nr:hypothetical protein [Acidimicrobiales bacterium]